MWNRDAEYAAKVCRKGGRVGVTVSLRSSRLIKIRCPCTTLESQVQSNVRGASKRRLAQFPMMLMLFSFLGVDFTALLQQRSIRTSPSLFRFVSEREMQEVKMSYAVLLIPANCIVLVLVLVLSIKIIAEP